MRTLLPLLLVAAIVAAAPATATAKGTGNATICGADGCRGVGGRDGEALLPPGRSAGPPSAPAPFVTVNIVEHEPGSPGATHTFTYDYLPSLGLTHARGPNSGNAWVALFPSARTRLDDLVKRIRPLPAAALTGIAQRPLAGGGGTPWWTVTGVVLAALALLGLLARYATTRFLNARPRASKSAN